MNLSILKKDFTIYQTGVRRLRRLTRCYIYIGIIKFAHILLVFEVNVDKDCRMLNFRGETL